MEDDENDRKSRQFTSPDQKRALEFVYQVNPRPNKKLQTYLSTTLGMSFKRVRVWFQNKRTREKTLREPLIRSCDEIIALLTSKMATNEGFTSLPTNNLVFHYSSDGANKSTSNGISNKMEDSTNISQLATLKTKATAMALPTSGSTRFSLSTPQTHQVGSPTLANPPSPSIISLSDNLHDNLTLGTNREATTSPPHEPPISDRFFSISKKSMLPTSPKNLSTIPIETVKRSPLSLSAPQKLPDFRNLVEQQRMNINNMINSTNSLFGETQKINSAMNTSPSSNPSNVFKSNNFLNGSSQQPRVSTPIMNSNLVNNPVNILPPVNNPFPTPLYSDNPFNNVNNNNNNIATANNQRIGGKTTLGRNAFPFLQSASPFNNVNQPIIHLPSISSPPSSPSTLPPLSSSPSSSFFPSLSSPPVSQPILQNKEDSDEELEIADDEPMHIPQSNSPTTPPNARISNHNYQNLNHFDFDKVENEKMEEMMRKSELISKIVTSSEADVVEYLKHKQNQNYHDNTIDIYAIHFAARKGYAKVIKKLIVSGASPSTRDYFFFTALHYAAKYNHLKTISLLIKFGGASACAAMNNQGKTPLFLATEFGHVGAMELLLKAESDPNARDLNGDSPLHIATRMGHYNATKILLDYRARLDNINIKNGYYPLHELPGSNVVNSTKLSIFKLFLHYIEEDKKEQVLNMRTLHLGETVLHLAAKSSPVDLIECMIINRCDPKATDFSGKTPLNTAAEANNFLAINLLIKLSDKTRLSYLINNSELRATI